MTPAETLTRAATVLRERAAKFRRLAAYHDWCDEWELQADWLETAAWLEERGYHFGPRLRAHALTLARRVLGEAS